MSKAGNKIIEALHEAVTTPVDALCIWNVVEWDGLGYEEYARWPFSSKEKAVAFILARNQKGLAGPYRIERAVLDSGHEFEPAE